MVRFLPLLLCGLASAQSFDWRAINEETLRHYQALVQIDSTDPPGNETKVVEYVKKVLEAEGIPVILAAKDPARANLIARLKGNGSKKPLLVMGHTDTVKVFEVGSVYLQREGNKLPDEPRRLAFVRRGSQRRLHLRPRHARRQGQSHRGNDDDGAAEAV